MQKSEEEFMTLKEVYDTKEVVEKIEIDSLTGEVISISSYPTMSQ